MCSSSMTVCILIVLQVSHVLVIAAQFAIIPPPKPVIGFLGKEVILPCQLESSRISEDIHISVQWIFVNSSKTIDVKSYDNRNGMETQDNRYRGRTELSHTELNKGNMSLVLKNSQISDQGKYICMIHLGDWFDKVVTELVLAAKGTEPTIALVNYNGQGIDLTCSSKGWYPKPQALWLDSNGKIQREESDTTNAETTAGNFSVSSSITKEPGVDSEVSCKIISPMLQMESESRILISDPFYPATPPWLAPYIVILLLFICLVAAVTYTLGQSYLKVSRYEKQKTETKNDQDHLIQAIETEKCTGKGMVAEQKKRSEVRRAQSHAVAITLDSDYKHPDVIISENKKSASLKTLIPGQAGTVVGGRIVVGKEGYTAGKHYWEVKVGDRLNWELGVLTQAERDKARQERFVKPLREGCWALRHVRGELFSSQDEKKVEKMRDVTYSVIGLLLDQEANDYKISFYNAGHPFLIVCIPIESTEKLHPFLSFGKPSEDKDQIPNPL
ncbi:butyrophilin subfamily 3 member A2-like isoform X2 [Rhineura floridana]|uniref:butyrophilin subfamily 3 member A2-like isoform X2 n=1 Tax=Rhineura floridana TaxID=261503 RepID=UPI002AC7EA73|nr:butyrophilin subfamily 3 member A2-like isoform X2 [Rhineura floridana]